MVTKPKTNLTKKDVERPKISIIEYIIIVCIVLLVISEINIISYRVKDANYTLDTVGLKAFIRDLDFLSLFDVIIIPITLLILILKRFSRDIKARISLILGVIVSIYTSVYTIDSISYFDILSKLGIFLFHSIILFSIIGIIYGILGIKSSKKNVAIAGIILNIPGLYFLILFISFFLGVFIFGFAP